MGTTTFIRIHYNSRHAIPTCWTGFMKKKFSLIHLLMLSILALSPSAQTGNMLYSSHIPVKSQDENELQQAMQQGFAQVIRRNTSMANALNNPLINKAMSNPQTYVIGFRYDKLTDTSPDSPHLFKLFFQFDEKAIKNLMNEAGLPIWGSNRPPLLVWWVIKSNGEPTLVNQETAPEIVALLNEQAQLRGIPLIFPLLDIQDNENIQPNDIWGFSLDRAKSASQRYGHENILLGRSDFLNDFGESRCLLLLGAETLNAPATQGQLKSMLVQAIDFTADHIAQRYAVSKQGNTQTDIQLIVSDINNLQAFAALEQYFLQLDTVKTVSIGSIKNREVTVNLSLNTDIAQFEKIIQLDNKLEKQPTENSNANAPNQETGHHYHWQDRSGY